MARAKKGARHIVVNGFAYCWRATGNDGFISLTVWPAKGVGGSISAMINYDETWTSTGPESRGLSPRRQLVVTNRIVSRVIELAGSKYGCNPMCEGTPLDLKSLENLIDLSDAVRSV